MLSSVGAHPKHFSVDTEPAGGAATAVRLNGELDMAGTFVLEPQLDEIVADPPDGGVVFDLRGLRFVDSTGLAALVGAHERLAGSGVPTRFVRGSDDVQRIFELAGFEGVLPFTD
jgi:stage II sporulation protein AA (anti-sigma F factor antagonist)